MLRRRRLWRPSRHRHRHRRRRLSRAVLPVRRWLRWAATRPANKATKKRHFRPKRRGVRSRAKQRGLAASLFAS
jgi:hypothetical protein